MIHPRSSSTLVAVFLLAVLPTARGQERDRLPLDPDERVPADVLAALAHLDPGVDGWRSEARQNQVSEVLAQLGDTIAGERDRLGTGISPGVWAGSLIPVAAEEALVHGPFVVARVSGGSSVEGQREITGREELASALGQLGQRLGPGVRAGFKILSLVSSEDGRLRTSVRVELSADSDLGPRQVSALWVCEWSLGESGPELIGLSVEDYEEVRGSASGPLFEDVTASVVEDGLLTGQLAQGISWWRERIDAYLGVGTLGHHGVCVADVNQDGLEDIYLCQPGGMPNKLLLHREDGSTLDVSTQAGVDLLGPSSSALLVDLDGDADADLVVCVADEVIFMENDGTGTFQMRTRHDAPAVTSLSAADVDNDGLLDIYACGYLSPYDGLAVPVPYHDAQNGQPNKLLLNQGEWRFVERTKELGLDANNRRFSFAAAWEDFDQDGDVDLYVANDFGRNNLYRNEGGVFVDVAEAYGVEDISAGMGVSWADVDGDGWMDLHVANMFSAAGQRVTGQPRFQPDAGEARARFIRHARGDSLFLNRDGQSFIDVSEQARIHAGRWAWGAVFLELDNDGCPDLYVPNGFVTGRADGDL